MPSVKKITSLTNPSIKQVIALREHKKRQETGLMIIEGVREVTQALKAGVELQEVYVCPGNFKNSNDSFVIASEAEGEAKQSLKRLLHPFGVRNDVCVNEVSEEVFAKMAYGQRQEGLLAIGRQPRRSLAQLKFEGIPLLIVVERMEKPGNLGAILRSCDGAGVDGLIVCDGRTDIYNPNVVRASLGTVFAVPVIESSVQETVDFLKVNKIKIFATLVEAEKVYVKADFRGPSVFVLGSEEEGLSDHWKKYCDEAVKIPMLGAADSLNVSATAAILVYEALRQRNTI